MRWRVGPVKMGCKSTNYFPRLHFLDFPRCGVQEYANRIISQSLLLTVSSGDAGDSPILYHVKQYPNADERGPDVDESIYESISSWESTASATTKSFLDTVKESSDAFGPLKSLAGGLCFILENCEVQSPPPSNPTTLTIVLGDRSKQASHRVAGAPRQNTL